MQTIKSIILGLLILFAAFLVGAILRTVWFYSIQKGQFERHYLYRDLYESKLGGKTPQETWNLYLDALSKGDIDTAVQYWVPEGRAAVSNHINELKKAGLLIEFSKNQEKQLRPLAIEGEKASPDKKSFSVVYKRDKKIDFIGAKGEVLEFLKQYWEQEKTTVVKTEETKVFVLNKYSERWLIKE